MRPCYEPLDRRAGGAQAQTGDLSRRQEHASLRIVVHDYAGHPFQFDLSRELARRGHAVAHMYFAGDPGPKSETARLAGDPESLSIVAVDTGRPYSARDFASRWANDRAYGRAVTPMIEDFHPDVVI